MTIRVGIGQVVYRDDYDASTILFRIPGVSNGDVLDVSSLFGRLTDALLQSGFAGSSQVQVFTNSDPLLTVNVTATLTNSLVHLLVSGSPN